MWRDGWLKLAKLGVWACRGSMLHWTAVHWTAVHLTNKSFTWTQCSGCQCRSWLSSAPSGWTAPRWRTSRSLEIIKKSQSSSTCCLDRDWLKTEQLFRSRRNEKTGWTDARFFSHLKKNTRRRFGFREREGSVEAERSQTGFDTKLALKPVALNELSKNLQISSKTWF